MHPGPLLNSNIPLRLALPKLPPAAPCLRLRSLDIPFPKAETGMESIENQHRNNNHDTFQHDKQRLVLDQRAVPPFTQLDDAVDRADEDADGRQR